MTLSPGASMVAYFSMEICLDRAFPTYAGGLGVLAGDALRSAADLHLPLVGVTLVHRKGYFRQHLDAMGNQTETPALWRPEDVLEPMPVRVSVTIEGREVHIRPWRYRVIGHSGHEVPIYLLDTALPENSATDQALTDYLYGGDSHYRLCQEVVLGMGGAAVLRALGHNGNVHFHINEGHAALLTLTLLQERIAEHGGDEVTEADLRAVRQRSVFTTHTPVPAGHDRFPMDLVRTVLGPERSALLETVGCAEDGFLNMTCVALRLARYVNGVAMRHGEVSREMFPRHVINSITNGVHAATWVSEPFRKLFDRRIPGWHRDNLYLRYAISIPLDEIRETHAVAKQVLLDEVELRTGVRLDPAAMTIGFARRATPYKRADLIISDLERLQAVTRHSGPLQIVFGGKAHPQDAPGKELIRRIYSAANALGDSLRIVYLENYEMGLAQRLVAGVDLWLNNPTKPLEASGTSGMKAALNGVPSLSVLDGWWIEGHVERVTGWSIGDDDQQVTDHLRDAADMYLKLEREILPLFYALPYAYAEIMRNAIAINGSFFNTQRMVRQYMHNAYFPTNNVTPEASTVAAVG